MTVSVCIRGIDFEVNGDYAAYYPATMYKSNGDPGDPAEGGCFEDYTITIEGVDVTDVLDSKIIEEIMEEAEIAADDKLADDSEALEPMDWEDWKD
jgi:hypothetical protein